MIPIFGFPRFFVNILEVYPVFFVLIPIEAERHKTEHFALEVNPYQHTFDVVVGVLRVPYHHLGVAIVVGGELVLGHFVSPLCRFV